ncbi:hypothetical protein, partial [Odoribacter splanchnicus]|uniref:hypothetical protein n=1 Tax=Odoribacter splanchnicus TaxID=28118 RepID=UPI00232F4F1C
TNLKGEFNSLTGQGIQGVINGESYFFITFAQTLKHGYADITSLRQKYDHKTGSKTTGWKAVSNSPTTTTGVCSTFGNLA